MDSFIEQLRVLGSVTLAMFFGAFIGWDREEKGKSAGLKTQMFVAGVSALFVFLANHLTDHFSGQHSTAIMSDPIRIIQAIVLGISFIGSGVIFHPQNGGEAQGITTAASLLLSASIGVCVALSQIVLAAGVTLLVLLILRTLQFLENRKVHSRSRP